MNITNSKTNIDGIFGTFFELKDNTYSIFTTINSKPIITYIVQTVFRTQDFDKRIIGLIYKAYWIQQKTSRKYTANTKTKSEIQGSGKKPWRQKGTGRARAGSRRSPLWVGGGVTFGPKPRIVLKKINKEELLYARALTLLLKTNILYVISDLFFTASIFPLKTKLVVSMLKHFNINLAKKMLLIVPEYSFYYKCRLYLGTRNIKNLTITSMRTLNISDLLNAKYILITPYALITPNKHEKYYDR